MKKLFILAAAALVAGSMMAQEPEKTAKPNNSPAVGSWSIGFTFNPVSLKNAIPVQPKTGEEAAAFIGTPDKKHQLFIISKDPLAAIRTKYHATEHLNVRLAVGFNGSHLTYNEYVTDDLARTLNPQSENKVIDRVRTEMNSTSFAAGVEYVTGERNLKFTMGANILYGFAGGKISYEYGNKITAANPVPSQMAMTATGGSLNPTPDAGALQGIAYARPLESVTAGFNHGLGFQIDMGIEWFFIKNLSLGVAATFTPVMFVFQPKTYTQYEGFSTISNQVEKYNALYSPDGFACLYGTENLGLQLSLNYYIGGKKEKK